MVTDGSVMTCQSQVGALRLPFLEQFTAAQGAPSWRAMPSHPAVQPRRVQLHADGLSVRSGHNPDNASETNPVAYAITIGTRCGPRQHLGCLHKKTPTIRKSVAQRIKGRNLQGSAEACENSKPLQ